MIPVSTQFEINRQAASNVVTYKAYLSLLNLAYSKVPVASSSYGAKYPVTAITNGDKTHRNYGLAVGDTGYDSLFPEKNMWQSNGEANPYFYIDLGTPYLINKIQIFGHPLTPDVTGFNIQTSIAAVDWVTQLSYLKVQGYNYKNSPVPAVSVNVGTGEITTNATMNELWFTSEVWARYIKFYCTAKSDTYIRISQFIVSRMKDISDDLVDFGIQDSMTYNLKRRMAKSTDVNLRNYDKQYSPTI